MATFPAVSTPTPDQWLYLIARQVLGAPAASIVVSGLSSSYRTITIDLSITKDATAAAPTLQLNSGGGGATYLWFANNGAVMATGGALGVTSVPLSLTGANGILGNRNGLWSIVINHLAPNHAMVICAGGYVRTTTVVWHQTWIDWNLGSASLSSFTIASASGNFAANTAIVVNGEERT